MMYSKLLAADLAYEWTLVEKVDGSRVWDDFYFMRAIGFELAKDLTNGLF